MICIQTNVNLNQQDRRHGKADPFGWMSYMEGQYTIKCHDGHLVTDNKSFTCGWYQKPNEITIDQIRHSISYAKPHSYSNLFVYQTRNQSQKTFNRKMSYIDTKRIMNSNKRGLTWGLTFKTSDQWTEDNTYEELRGIDVRKEMIGLFIDETYSLYILFRDDKAITYRLISDVSDEVID